MATYNSCKNFHGPFYKLSSTASRLQSHYEELIYFYPLGPRKYLALILSTSEEKKAESTMEPTRGTEIGTPDMVTQRPNHYATTQIRSSLQHMM